MASSAMIYGAGRLKVKACAASQLVQDEWQAAPAAEHPAFRNPA